MIGIRCISRQGVMHGFGGRKLSVPILRFVALGYGVLSPAGVVVADRICGTKLLQALVPRRILTPAA